MNMETTMPANKVDFLYVNGCSFTRMPSHNGHPSLEEQWPHLLGEKLGIPETFNDGLWNSSNYRIFRRLNGFLNTTSISSENIFVIIAFTIPWRFEFHANRSYDDHEWIYNPVNDPWIKINPGHVQLDITPQQENFPVGAVSIAGKYLQEYNEDYEIGKYKAYAKAIRYTPEEEYLETITQILAIDNLLNLWGVRRRYTYGHSFCWRSANGFHEKIPHFFNNHDMSPLFNDHRTIDSVHPDHAGNRKIANAFYDELRDII